MKWWNNLFGKRTNKKETEIFAPQKTIEPTSTWNGDTPILVMYVSSCANMMFAGEMNYLRSIGKFESVFDRNIAGDYVLERISLIVSFLSTYNIKIKDGWDRLWLKQVATNYDTSNKITQQGIKSLFERRYNFYSVEIEMQKHSQWPISNTIISQLYKPMFDGELSHKQPLQNMFNLQENLAIWNIITTEVGKMMEKIQKNREYIYSTKNNP